MDYNRRKLNIQLMCIFLVVFPLKIFPQNIEQPKPGWHLKDLKTDSVFGISMEKAYKELLKGKKVISVTVAVLDGGIDISHEDLRNSIWQNPGEKPGNKKDDDDNGYIDDVYGWNFFSRMDKKEDVAPDTELLKELISEQTALKKMRDKIGKPVAGAQDFRDYIPQSAKEAELQLELVKGLKQNPDYDRLLLHQMERDINVLEMMRDYAGKPAYDLLTAGPLTHHGTHVAGIIAAGRNNGIGVNGVSDQVKIMVLRPIRSYRPVRRNVSGAAMRLKTDGQEHMQAALDAIRYAADNGAKVINMSFGNTATWPEATWNEVVKYAAEKDVLIVHSAGNLGLDLDQVETYPRRGTASGKRLADSWISVGSSGSTDDQRLADPSSNFGKMNVDVFAPGTDITSTAPGNTYWTDSGTSMAAPVVSGLAAVIRSYYPKLTAAQVKEIIVKSVVKREVLKDKCISGGVINAYEALKMAAAYKAYEK